MSLALFLLAQAGTMVTPGAAPPLPHQTAPVERPARRRGSPNAALPVPAAGVSQLRGCLDSVRSDPQAAVATATAWAAKAEGAEKSAASYCLGQAFGGVERWTDAEAAFLVARDTAPVTDSAQRARLGAMAGNAALAAGAPDRALAALDRARDNAAAASDTALAADIATDRARALVALKRNAEAETALAEARSAAPANPQAWLLSATLSRRTGKLAQAQAQIQKAAELLPVDPEIGLEAGLIAVLSGRDEAARKSWQSVIAAAPDSDAAATARGYIAQLPPAPGVAKP